MLMSVCLKACRPILRPVSSISERQADILHQQFRLFERSEMAPTGHFRPVLDIVSALDPALGRQRVFPFRKTRNSARDCDVITFLEVKRGAVILVIEPA